MVHVRTSMDRWQILIPTLIPHVNQNSEYYINVLRVALELFFSVNFLSHTFKHKILLSLGTDIYLENLRKTRF